MRLGLGLSLPLALLVAACAQKPPAETAADATDAGPPPPAAEPVEAESLRAYHWRLSEARDAQGATIEALFPRADKPLQLDFTAEHLGVANACNRIGGPYKLEDGRLQVARLAQTMMACADRKLADADPAISQRLESSPRVSLQPGDTPRLSLVTDNGDTLVFEGRPTPETRYGSPGETVFLEVAPQRVACSHPLIPNHQCLRVRERYYDAQGLVSGEPGEWQPLYQEIEGYTHEPGVRNVVRVKRFEVKDPPADASSVAYVLDMVVESETAKP